MGPLREHIPIWAKINGRRVHVSGRCGHDGRQHGARLGHAAHARAQRLLLSACGGVTQSLVIAGEDNFFENKDKVKILDKV
jgi:hypothetical protein